MLFVLAAANHGDLDEILSRLEALRDLPAAGALTLKAIEQLLEKVELLGVSAQAPCTQWGIDLACHGLKSSCAQPNASSWQLACSSVSLCLAAL